MAGAACLSLLAALACIVCATSASSASPPPWPPQFFAQIFSNNSNSIFFVQLSYDYTHLRNLMSLQMQNGTTIVRDIDILLTDSNSALACACRLS